MLAIEKWIKGKPFLFALLAPHLAILARDLHKDFHDVKRRRFMEKKFPFPDLALWSNFYQSPQKSNQFLYDLLTKVDDLKLLTTPPTPEIDPAVIQQQVLEMSLLSIKDEINQRAMNTDVRDRIQNALAASPQETSFFVLVNIPCLLLYRMTPHDLYAKALTGHFESLEKLLMLDPLLLHDPAIGERIQELRLNNRTTKYQKLLEATLKDPFVTITSKTVKYAMGGLLSAIAELAKIKLTTPDIHRLFDAVARDFDKRLCDHDFQPGDDTFYTAMRRYRTCWLSSMQPDIKMSN